MFYEVRYVILNKHKVFARDTHKPVQLELLMQNTCIVGMPHAEHLYIVARLIQNTCIVWHASCRTPVYCGTPYAEHLYGVACLM